MQFAKYDFSSVLETDFLVFKFSGQFSLASRNQNWQFHTVTLLTFIHADHLNPPLFWVKWQYAPSMQTLKISHQDKNKNNYNWLKFKDFQNPLTSNSKTFKALFNFQGLSRSWKIDTYFRNFQESVATLPLPSVPDKINNSMISSINADLNFLCQQWRLKVWFDNDFDLHLLSTDLTHQRNDSKRQTDVLRCTISDTTKCLLLNIWLRNKMQSPSHATGP